MKKLLVGSLLIGGILISCKKKEEVTKEETKAFITRSSGVGTNTASSDAFLAMSDFWNSQPPGVASLTKAIAALGERNYKKAIKTFSLNDSIACFYGTWTHTGTFHWDTTRCGTPIYTEWDYVPSDSQWIKFIWDYIGEDGNTHQALLKLYNINLDIINNDTVLKSLSAHLKSDGNDIMNFDFQASYDQNAQMIYLYILLTIYNVGEYKIEAQAASGHTLEDSVFVGNVKGYAKDFVQNYTLNYSWTNHADTSGSVQLYDSDGWKLVINYSKPTHTQHTGYEVHYYHSLTGTIEKDGNKGADLVGEFWVTEPPYDEQHHTWLKATYNDGTEEDIWKYIAPTSVMGLLFNR